MITDDEDQEYQNNVRFRDYLATLGVRPEFVVLPQSGHNGRAYADEGTGFRFLSRYFASAAERATP
jgi:hypothetical protein